METNAPKKRGRPPKVKEAVEKSIQSSAQHVLEEAFEPAAEVAVEEPVSAPTRPSMRPTMREEDSRTRAARRAAELRDHLGDTPEGVDEFYIDPNDIPEGWDYEWKTKYVLGQEQGTHILALRRAGWEEVPTSRHPSFMPMDTDLPFIERKGMVLMERPLEISDEARALDLRRARQQVRQKEAQLNSAESGQFERSNKDQSLVKIQRSYESIPIPND